MKLLEDLDTLVDQSIGAMSAAKLKQFRRERKKIMGKAAGRELNSFNPKPSRAL
jgi:hypothetical protein